MAPAGESPGFRRERRKTLKRIVFMLAALTVLAAAALVPLHRTTSIAVAASNGGSVFSKNCAVCHQANGQGVPGSFPPLAGNSYVTGDPNKVIHTVLAGMTGKVMVNGKSYNGQMPAWKGKLSNADIAAVITYIRSSWGNKASGVTEAQVAKAK